MKYCVVFGCCTMDIAIYESDGTEVVSFGGKGGNQAVALSRAGVKTYMLTKFSAVKDDKRSTKMHLKNLKKNKVDTKYIAFDKELLNDYTKINISKNGDNDLMERIIISQNIDVDYVKKNKQVFENAEYVLLQMKVPIEATRDVVKICKEANVKTVLTPCRPKKLENNMDILEDVSYITCNQKEAELIFGEGKKLSAKKLEETLKKYPNKLIVTLGGKGVKYFDGKKVVTEKAIEGLSVLDTTGAGDTFCANFVSVLFDGGTISEAVQKAICSSSIKIQTKGTQNGMPKKKQRDELYLRIYKNKGENKND